MNGRHARGGPAHLAALLALLLPAACHGSGNTTLAVSQAGESPARDGEARDSEARDSEARDGEARDGEARDGSRRASDSAVRGSAPSASADPAGVSAGAGSSAAREASDLAGAARASANPPNPRSAVDVAGGSAPLAPSRRFPPQQGRTLRAIASDQICTTLGEVRPSGAPRPSGAARSATGALLVEDPKLRATLAGSDGNGVELAFRYLGPTAQTSTLRSGSDRRQLGVELSARDTCNVLYVMWRIEPASELVVQVKSNGAQSTHAECENRGYRRLRPSVSTPVPALTPGTEHRLRAEITDAGLSVHVDGALVWSGPLDADARQLHGKSGLRSDNARFELLELFADGRPEALATCSER